MKTFECTPLALVIEPEPGNPLEVEGVLNPAVARGPDGQLYLFPRIVAKNNYSRIGIMRVLFDDAGDPCDVERLGVALEPEAPYELRPDGGGGCEDPRIAFVEDLQLYVMTYTAFSTDGPRIAIAVSKDLLQWERLGLATYEPHESISFNGVDNKDAAFFPMSIRNPTGPPSLAMLHRPLFDGTLPEDNAVEGDQRTVDLHRECIWISHSSMDIASGDLSTLTHFDDHHRLATPVMPWEALKIGSGVPPMLTPLGWMLVYHGVSSVSQPDATQRLTYSAGVMVLDKDKPLMIQYRSTEPILVPSPSDGPRGTPSNVVFPTGGIDRRSDLHDEDRYDIYYGYNDFRIGVAKLTAPRELPPLVQGDPVVMTRKDAP